MKRLIPSLPKYVVVNARFGCLHLQVSTPDWKLTLYKNYGHAVERISWWPPKTVRGEFRKKDGWKWFKVYRFLWW